MSSFPEHIILAGHASNKHARARAEPMQSLITTRSTGCSDPLSSGAFAALADTVLWDDGRGRPSSFRDATPAYAPFGRVVNSR